MTRELESVIVLVGDPCCQSSCRYGLATAAVVCDRFHT